MNDALSFTASSAAYVPAAAGAAVRQATPQTGDAVFAGMLQEAAASPSSSQATTAGAGGSPQAKSTQPTDALRGGEAAASTAAAPVASTDLAGPGSFTAQSSTSTETLTMEESQDPMGSSVGSSGQGSGSTPDAATPNIATPKSGASNTAALSDTEMPNTVTSSSSIPNADTSSKLTANTALSDAQTPNTALPNAASQNSDTRKNVATNAATPASPGVFATGVEAAAAGRKTDGAANGTTAGPQETAARETAPADVSTSENATSAVKAPAAPGAQAEASPSEQSDDVPALSATETMPSSSVASSAKSLPAKTAGGVAEMRTGGTQAGALRKPAATAKELAKTNRSGAPEDSGGNAVSPDLSGSAAMATTQTTATTAAAIPAPVSRQDAEPNLDAKAAGTLDGVTATPAARTRSTAVQASALDRGSAQASAAGDDAVQAETQDSTFKLPIEHEVAQDTRALDQGVATATTAVAAHGTIGAAALSSTPTSTSTQAVSAGASFSPSLSAPVHTAHGTGADGSSTSTGARGGSLEVGFHDSTLGWLSVRASVDRAGDLHAAVAGRSSASATAVSGMLPALGRFLQEQNVVVGSVSSGTALTGTVSGMASALASDAGSAGLAQGGGSQPQGQAQQQQRSPDNPSQRQDTAERAGQVAASGGVATRADAASLGAASLRGAYGAADRMSSVSVRI